MKLKCLSRFAAHKFGQLKQVPLFDEFSDFELELRNIQTHTRWNILYRKQYLLNNLNKSKSISLLKRQFSRHKNLTGNIPYYFNYNNRNALFIDTETLSGSAFDVVGNYYPVTIAVGFI
jgi:hypothetical protein